MAPTLLKLSCISAVIKLLQAQQLALQPQNDTWNSSFTFAPSQLTGTNISAIQASNIELALNFERSNWATGSIASDPFYTSIPSSSTTLPAGSLLKVQSYINTTTYVLPPYTALSRILYLTESLTGEPIPASAYILWPYLPLTYPNLTNPDQTINGSKYPVIAWAHGTSGVFSQCAPSHLRNLLYEYTAPYTLALSGYVVVAPDFQGLGVNATVDGSPIPHPYLAAPAAANDLFYAVEAAQAAFADRLSKEFVVMGHSQGGGAAWGAAIRQANQPVEGYLGTVAGSPPTSVAGEIALLGGLAPPTLGLFAAEAILGLYPDFNQSSILTDEGLARFRVAKDQGMCSSGIEALLSDFPGGDNGRMLRTGWDQLPEVVKYLSLCDVGTQKIAGPVLVLQGTADTIVPEVFTTASVQSTCAVMEGANGWNGLEYWRFDGVTHDVLYPSQLLWLEWIGQRFACAGGRAGGGNVCVMRNFTSGPAPVDAYQKERNYFLELATAAYQVA